MAHDDVVVSHCCVLDLDTLDSINITDPRQFSLKHGTQRLLELTSVSWHGCRLNPRRSGRR